MKNKKILLVQDSLMPPGGANSVAVWLIEALKQECRLSILTWDEIDFEAINGFYGTHINEKDVEILRVSRWWQRLIAMDPNPENIKKICVLMRYARRLGSDFDLMLTATREVDFGRSSIQYIHYPWFTSLYRSVYSPNHHFRNRFFHVKYFFSPWRVISGFSFERMKRNLTLVNSDWTGRRIQEVYGLKTCTVYPPVCEITGQQPWNQRENGFICIGRIAPEKRLGRLISILTAVRSQGHSVHLHVIGNQGKLPHEIEYYRKIRNRIAENPEWISLHEDISRNELIEVIACHRYGIHRMEEEPFGIAIAEMVKGGCIVFVPESGGQVEIVGEKRQLLFRSNEDAVKKIRCVLENQNQQYQLLDYLKSRQEFFSENRFMGKIREMVTNRLGHGLNDESRDFLPKGRILT